MRVSERLPWLFPVAVRAHRARRRLRWGLDRASGRVRWAHTHDIEAASVPVFSHDSVLLRELEGAEMVLQHNKVTNLRLATAAVDGLVIRPGETFSFNRVVGNPTGRRGYIEGMQLSNGHSHAAVGGGICQLANMLHWLVLHSPLTVTERSDHSFDPFPDAGRVVPWGTGCTIVFNYVDLAFRNDTEWTFVLRTWVGETHLHGELLASAPLGVSYLVEAREEEFTCTGDPATGAPVFRSNQIWRTTYADDGSVLDQECVKTNRARVIYHPDPALIQRR